MGFPPDKPSPADISYHSPKPLFEGQKITEGDCPYLEGKPCYCDGSGLQSKEVFDRLVREGSEGAWKYLEDRYVGYFGELK
jgi:hypothetical protein